MGWRRPLPNQDLPEPLRASDGLRPDAPPEDLFTKQTITERMPKILDSTLAKWPKELKVSEVVLGVRELQEEMRGNAPLPLGIDVGSLFRT